MDESNKMEKGSLECLVTVVAPFGKFKWTDTLKSDKKNWDMVYSFIV